MILRDTTKRLGKSKKKRYMAYIGRYFCYFCGVMFLGFD